MTRFSKVRKRRVFYLQGFLRKIVKRVFLIALLSDQKRGKSQQGGFAPSSFRTSCGVHELVARSSAWQVRAAKDKSKVGSFTAPRNLILPRVRTHHTKKPSRFVHALSARPLKVQGGRESSTRADESKDFCQPSPVGEGGARSVTDEVSFVKKT